MRATVTLAITAGIFLATAHAGDRRMDPALAFAKAMIKDDHQVLVLADENFEYTGKPVLLEMKKDVTYTIFLLDMNKEDPEAVMWEEGKTDERAAPVAMARAPFTSDDHVFVYAFRFKGTGKRMSIEFKHHEHYKRDVLISRTAP